MYVTVASAEYEHRNHLALHPDLHYITFSRLADAFIQSNTQTEDIQATFLKSIKSETLSATTEYKRVRMLSLSTGNCAIKRKSIEGSKSAGKEQLQKMAIKEEEGGGDEGGKCR